MKDVNLKFGGFNVESRKNYEVLKESNLNSTEALKKLDSNSDRKLSDTEMKKLKDIQAEYSPENKLVEIDDAGFDEDNASKANNNEGPSGEFQMGQRPDKKPDKKPGGDKTPPEFLNQSQGSQMMDMPQGPMGPQGDMQGGPRGMMGEMQGGFGPQGMQGGMQGPMGRGGHGRGHHGGFGPQGGHGMMGGPQGPMGPQGGMQGGMQGPMGRGGQGQMMDMPQGPMGPQGGMQGGFGPQGMQGGMQGPQMSMQAPQGGFEYNEEFQSMRPDNEFQMGQRPDKKPDKKPGGDKTPSEFSDKTLKEED